MMSFLHKTRRRWQRYLARRNRKRLDQLTDEKAIRISFHPDLGFVKSGEILDSLRAEMAKRDARKVIRARATQPD